MYPDDKSDVLNYQAFNFVCEHCPRREVCKYEYKSDDCICSKDYSEFISKLYEAEQIMHRAIFTANKKLLREIISNFYGD